MDTGLIEQTLEQAAERGDLTPAVYALLFKRYPDMQALFVRDTNGLVRGSMLSWIFEAILDFIGNRSYSPQMIQNEVITHDGYGVPPETFGLFFEVLVDTLRSELADSWTPAHERAWADLVDQLNWLSQHPYATASA